MVEGRITLVLFKYANVGDVLPLPVSCSAAANRCDATVLPNVQMLVTKNKPRTCPGFKYACWLQFNLSKILRRCCNVLFVNA